MIRRALILFLALAGPALAADEREYPLAVELETAFGLDDVPPGWIPVRITAENRRTEPEEREGRDRFVFRVAAKMRWNETTRMVAVREETIPPGGKKRFWMYGYADGDEHEIAVSVSHAVGGDPAAKRIELDRLGIHEPGYGQSYGQQNTEPFRIGVLSGRNPTALGIVKSITLPNRLRAEPRPLEPEDLPDRRVGYGPLDLVVLNDLDLARLTPEQREALRSWVLGGGRLLVSPGLDASWLAQPFFRDLLPPGRPRVEMRETVDKSKVPPYAAVVWEPADPKLALPSKPGGSSLTGFRAGRGLVDLVFFDIAGAPLKDLPENARRDFWSFVFSRFSARTPRHLGRGWPVEIPAKVDAGPHRLLVPDQEAPILSIAVLALAYVALVGPVNFLLLRRAGREPWIVVTIPAVAVVFVAATFVAGTLWMGSRSRVFEATLIRARSGQRFALDERLTAILPARAMSVAIPFRRGEDGLAISTEDEDAAARGFEIVQRERLALRGLSVARWEAGVIRADSIRDLAGPIAVEIGDGGVTIVNESARDLERVIVHHAGLYHLGGTVPAGGRATLAPRPQHEVAADERRAPRRATLEGRAYQFCFEWVGTSQRPWSLAALVRPDPPPPAAEGEMKELVPEERAAVLLLEP